MVVIYREPVLMGGVVCAAYITKRAVLPDDEFSFQSGDTAFKHGQRPAPFAYFLGIRFIPRCSSGYYLIAVLSVPSHRAPPITFRVR
jgi:hypothetical protein